MIFIDFLFWLRFPFALSTNAASPGLGIRWDLIRMKPRVRRKLEQGQSCEANEWTKKHVFSANYN